MQQQDQKVRILFLCTGNSCRSQMAEGWARQLKSDEIEAASAGTDPAQLHPKAVEAMAEAGVDISAQRSKHVNELSHLEFDYVITLCGNAHESCPVFPGETKVVHRGFKDPSEVTETAKTALAAFRNTRDEIREFVNSLPESLEECNAASPTGHACCGAPCNRKDVSWMDGVVGTAAGDVPRVGTTLRLEDRVGSWKARWGIGRMDYTVGPGLYAVGNPTAESPVLVTANYKMSFDRLRSQLSGRDAWIMALDTKGINVWCAAGKGTFGTEEVVRRLGAVRLSEIVTHRTLILPQLGAVGVAAHEVKKQSGFRVVYGPVRAEDLPDFLDSDMKATPEMRRVRFAFRDRIVLIPIELMAWVKYGAVIAAAFLILSGVGRDIYSFARAMSVGLPSLVLFLAAYLAGVALTPALLPWLPGRAFASKGAWAGFLLVLLVVGSAAMGRGLSENRLSAVAWFVMIPTVASFLGMNFTGASTYTSLSGVRREMRVAVPVQAACAVVGAAMWLAARFV